MNDAASYWSPICELVSQLRCWVRAAWREDDSTVESWWGQLLGMPVDGYLEAAGGPTPVRDIEWVDLSTRRIKGGLAGRPRQMIDATDEIVAALQKTRASWQFHESTWSITGIFEEEPVRVIRIANPFGPK
jgi:hypothetical protein